VSERSERANAHSSERSERANAHSSERSERANAHSSVGGSHPDAGDGRRREVRVTTLRAGGFPESAVRARAESGPASAFPAPAEYGHTLFGADPVDSGGVPADMIDRLRLVPPVFVPHRLDKLLELAREPVYRDVALDTEVGGFRSTRPLYLSAFGSTESASVAHGLAASRQAGRLGIPMVVGENVMPVNGYGRIEEDAERSLLGRVTAYAEHALDGYGGVVVQQSTEDADAEVWNLVYSDPNVQALLDSGRLAFELKVGQGAKPGLGGMTLLDPAAAARLADAYLIDPVFGGTVLRCSSPGTFTEEILRQQIRLMRNNYPRAGVWVKLPPARDVRAAALVAWAAGADAVTVDGAEAARGVPAPHRRPPVVPAGIPPDVGRRPGREVPRAWRQCRGPGSGGAGRGGHRPRQRPGQPGRVPVAGAADADQRAGQVPRRCAEPRGCLVPGRPVRPRR
jgi:methylamine---glutamate N-methyltransferase subunit C